MPPVRLDNVRSDHARQRARQHRRRVVSVINLVVRRKAARDVLGTNIRSGRGNRVQHVIAGFEAAEAPSPVSVTTLPMPTVLSLNVAPPPVRLTSQLTEDDTTQGARQHLLSPS